MSRRLLPKPPTNVADEQRPMKPLERRAKRICVATACMPCRKRRSKCDGNAPCAPCVSSNGHSKCVYDKQGDGRRSGTLRRHLEDLAEDNKTFSCILNAIRTSPESYAQSVMARLRTDEKYVDIANFIREHPFDGAASSAASAQPASPTTGTTDRNIPKAPTEAASPASGSADGAATPEAPTKY